MTFLCCNYSYTILTAEQQQSNDEHNIAKEDTKKKQFTLALCNKCCQTLPVQPVVIILACQPCLQAWKDLH